MPVFPRRPLLHEQLALAVENKHVNGSMPQVIPMHFTARSPADKVVIFVDDREELGIARIGRDFSREAGPIRKGDPLLQAELLGTRSWIETNRDRGLFPVGNL